MLCTTSGGSLPQMDLLASSFCGKPAPGRLDRRVATVKEMMRRSASALACSCTSAGLQTHARGLLARFICQILQGLQSLQRTFRHVVVLDRVGHTARASPMSFQSVCRRKSPQSSRMASGIRRRHARLVKRYEQRDRARSAAQPQRAHSASRHAQCIITTNAYEFRLHNQNTSRADNLKLCSPESR